jgi:hypothetical protein
MKGGIFAVSLALVLLLAASAEAYSFQDALEDFIGFFDNLITGFASGNLCGENEDVCKSGFHCHEGYVETTGTGCSVGPDPFVCCREIICGDNYLDTGEGCDDGSLNGKECIPEYGSKCDYCSTNCKIIKLDGAYCGDNNCDKEYEDEITCPEDCDTSGSSCGDGTCSKSEDCSSCKQDCGCTKSQYCSEGICLEYPYCGDSLCNGEETCSSCSEDCGDCGTNKEYCGNKICSKSEDCISCEKDCGDCTGYCGDNNCNKLSENCKLCEKDCGSCSEEGEIVADEQIKQLEKDFLKKAGFNENELKVITSTINPLKDMFSKYKNNNNILSKSIIKEKKEYSVTKEYSTKDNKKQILFSFKEKGPRDILLSGQIEETKLSITKLPGEVPRLSIDLSKLF